MPDRPHPDLADQTARSSSHANAPIPLVPALAALAYAVAGWPVLPLHTPTRTGCSCRRAACAHAGKHPRSAHGLADATTDIEQLAAWWQRWPDANVGVRTGRLIVIDVDGQPGSRSLAALQAAHERLPATRRASTARGQHLYFRADDRDIPCTVGALGPGLDVRGRGGYVVAPPSRHPTGHRYHWTDPHDIAPLPAWLARLLTTPKGDATRRALPPAVTPNGNRRAHAYAHAALDAELAQVARAPVGTRNATLNRAAFRLGQLVGSGLCAAEPITEALLAAALHAGLGEREARATIASGLRAGHRHPRRLASPARGR